MYRAISLFAIICLIVMNTGCATIFKGDSEELFLTSEPNSVEVYINGQLFGKTPIQLNLNPKNTYYIEFVKDGFERKVYVPAHTVGAGWVILDILSGVIPVIIDAATGKWNSFDQPYPNVILDEIRYLTKDSSISDSLKNQTWPTHLSIELESGVEKELFSGNVELFYETDNWEKSKLSAKGIVGFTKNIGELYQNDDIRFSKYDIIYMKINRDVTYRIEVTQEVLSKVYL